MVDLLCPACARAPQTESGFCEACSFEERTERYLERQAEEAAARREGWAARTLAARRRWDAERQRRRRLLRATRPRTPAPPDADPLQLAHRALRLLEGLRRPAAMAGERQALEEVSELVRQLAWGPAAETRPSEARRAPFRTAPG